MRRFLGWEPSHVAVHEYDDDGRLVRTVSTPEVEWDDDERAWMLALAELEAQSCDGCGGWLAVTTDVKMSDGYVAEHPLRCHRCEALAVRRKAVREKPNPEAFTVWPVRERGQ